MRNNWLEYFLNFILDDLFEFLNLELLIFIFLNIIYCLLEVL